MLHNDPTTNQLMYCMPIKDISELIKYRKAILRLLKDVSINSCDREMNEMLKIIYKLLDNLPREEE